MQLDNCNTLREEMDLVAKVAKGITFRRDNNIIEETAGENTLLDGIQKMLMVSYFLT